MTRDFELIYACGYEGEIGNNNDLLWNLPRDMAHFVKVTKHSMVFMGRSTYESLPEFMPALPKRANFVITSQPEKVCELHAYRSWKKLKKTDSIVDESVQTTKFYAHSTIEEAYKESNLIKENYATGKRLIIGGARMYDFALSEGLVNIIHRTVVHHRFPFADTKWNPDLKNLGFKIIESTHYAPDLENEYGMTIEKWIYKKEIER